MTTEDQRKKTLEWFNNLCAWTISRWPDERMEYVETIRTALSAPVQCEAVGNEYCWRHDQLGKECRGEPVQCVPEEAASDIEEFIRAVKMHINEYGAGGYLLARLSDAEKALALLNSAATGGEKK
jgi:hypothetical protein